MRLHCHIPIYCIFASIRIPTVILTQILTASWLSGSTQNLAKRPQNPPTGIWPLSIRFEPLIYIPLQNNNPPIPTLQFCGAPSARLCCMEEKSCVQCERVRTQNIHSIRLMTYCNANFDVIHHHQANPDYPVDLTHYRCKGCWVPAVHVYFRTGWRCGCGAAVAAPPRRKQKWAYSALHH